MITEIKTTMFRGEKVTFVPQGYGKDKFFTDKVRADNANKPKRKPKVVTEKKPRKLSPTTLKIGSLVKAGWDEWDIRKELNITPTQFSRRLDIYEKYREEIKTKDYE